MSEREAITCGDYDYVLLDDGAAEIVDYDGEDENLAIPAELDGHSVTSIGEGAFWGCTSLSSITIPDSVTSIGDSAFWGCTNLSSITIPDSETIIEDCAFNGCTSLSSITIPEGVTYIGEDAFKGCEGLTSVIVDRISFAKKYCIRNGLPCVFADGND